MILSIVAMLAGLAGASLAAWGAYVAARSWVESDVHTDADALRAVRRFALVGAAVLMLSSAALLFAKAEAAAVSVAVFASVFLVVVGTSMHPGTRHFTMSLSLVVAALTFGTIVLAIALPLCGFGGCAPAGALPFLMFLNEGVRIKIAMLATIVAVPLLLFHSAIAFRVSRRWSHGAGRVVPTIAIVVLSAVAGASVIAWRATDNAMRDTARPITGTATGGDSGYWWTDPSPWTPHPVRWWLDEESLPSARVTRYLGLERRAGECRPVPFGAPAIDHRGMLYVRTSSTLDVLDRRLDLESSQPSSGQPRQPTVLGYPVDVSGEKAVVNDMGIIHTLARDSSGYVIEAADQTGRQFWRKRLPSDLAIHALVPAPRAGVFAIGGASVSFVQDTLKGWIIPTSTWDWGTRSGVPPGESQPLAVTEDGTIYMLARLTEHGSNVELVAFEIDGSLDWRLPLVTYSELLERRRSMNLWYPPSTIDAGPVVTSDGTILAIVNARMRAVRRDGYPLWTSPVLARRVLPQGLTVSDDGTIYALVETDEDCVGIEIVTPPNDLNHGGLARGWSKHAGNAANAWHAMQRERPGARR